MISTYQEAVKLFKQASVELTPENFFFYAQTDLKIHSGKCPEYDDPYMANSTPLVDLVNFLKNPEDHLHKECYSDLSNYYAVFHHRTSDDEITFEEFIAETLSLLKPSSFKKAVTARSFRENMDCLEKIDSRPINQAYSNATYKKQNYPVKALGAIEKITQHLVDNEPDGVFNYLADYYNRKPHESNGDIKDLWDLAVRSGKDTEMLNLFNSLHEFKKADSRLMLCEAEEMDVRTWYKEQAETGYDAHLEFILDLIVKKTQPKGAKHWQLPAAYQDIIRNGRATAEIVFIDDELSAEELLTLDALKHGGSNTLEAAYQSTVALR